MKKTLLTAVSAIAILGAGPVLAENTKTMKPGSEAAANASTGNFTQDVQNAWANTKDDVSDATDTVSDAAKDTYESVSEATKDAYKDVKQVWNDNDDEAQVGDISIDPRMTAGGMLGEPVFNVNGERVAKIRDIILDKNGRATMVVMADGDFTGLGKLVAFDYNVITTRSADGDVIASLDESMIDNAATFSYDRGEYSDSVRVIPSNGFSAAELLDGELVNPQGETLAEVDNIVFRNGQASQVIVGFGGMLGVGGEQAALPFGEADLKRNGDSIDFKLSANETQDFKAYKETALN